VNVKRVLSYMGIFAIIGLVVVIVSLSLLGPVVGNVFSNIVSNYTGYSGQYATYPTSPPYDPGSTYGGVNPVNDEPYRDMFFESNGVNPFIDTEDDPLSTFALDVDTGSYTIVRSYLRDGNLPPKEAVRVEEFVNYFDMQYPQPKEASFAIYLDGGSTPFAQNEHYKVIRIGIQGMQIPEESRKDAVLTFVIDVSGSMGENNRLEMVKSALSTMVHNLRPTDKVGIVIYDDTTSVLLPMSSISESNLILDAISGLQPGGATNAEAGLKLGYQMSNDAYTSDAINRVILCSDGVANVGITGHEGILESIQDSAEGGITLTTVGVGLGNYNDLLLEQLADQGDGFYAYIDTVEEAEKLFTQNLTSTLQTIAMDAKIQVAFNPEVVSRYRLIGYENRGMADEEFEDESADAGEIGVGLSVTALYEIKLLDGASGEAATVSLRWKDPDSSLSQTLSASIDEVDLASSFETTSSTFQLSVVMAEFAEILRQSYWAQEVTLGDLQQVIQKLDSTLLEEPDVAEFVQLVQRAWDLTGETLASDDSETMPTSSLPALPIPQPTQLYSPTPPANTPMPSTSSPSDVKAGYGYSEMNPIRVGGGPDHGPLREEWFLLSLHGPQGQDIQYQRIGSITPFKSSETPLPPGFLRSLDIYDVSYVGLQEPLTLYIDMYQCEAPHAPQGFSFTPDPALPSGKLIFFSQSAILAEDIAYNMFLLDGETQCIHYVPIQLNDVMPFALSPDGTQIAYSLMDDDGWHLFLGNMDGGESRQLTHGEFVDIHPSWSPDGDQIVFVRSDSYQTDLYQISLDTNEIVQLTNDQAIELMPSWSPDGSRIAFSSDRTGNDEIFIINSDGSNLQQISVNSGSDVLPVWSPDGKILFSSERNGSYDLFLMNDDGTNLQPLTDSEFQDIFPTWSPDGQQIAFCSERDGNTDLYVMNVDGSGLVNLTEAWSWDCMPQWIQ